MKGREYMPLPKDEIYTSEDYWNLSDNERAELIDGRLYNMAPPTRIHQELVITLSSAILQHIKNNHGICKVYPAPFAVNLSSNDKTWVEPDISIICNKNILSDRGCEGPPDWIIEIVSPGSARIDYSVKLFKYRTAGVREYWIVNPMTKTVQTYSFEDEEDSNQYTFEAEIPSHIFEDFTIKIAALINDNI